MSFPRLPLLLLAVCLVTASVLAQNAPPPPAPFPSPITGFVGRYLDSTEIANFQAPPRTFRARLTKVAPERNALYMIIGSTFVRQTLSTFASRVASEPLLTSRWGEKYLAFDDFVDAQRSGGTWVTPASDGQDRLFDFDWDDRGLTYLAYSKFGVGIVDENLDLVHQFFPVVIDPRNVVAFRNGVSYYALISDDTSGDSALYDVTTPTAPVLLSAGPSSSPDAVASAKSATGFIALAPFLGALEIHTPATLASGAAPVQTVPTGGGSRRFRDVTTDGTNFYAIEDSFTAATIGAIHVLQPSGGTFTDTVHVPVEPRANDSIDFGAGYLTVSSLFAGRTAIYRVAGNTLTLLHDGSYFAYTDAIPETLTFTALPVISGEQTILIAAMNGLGDVFALESPVPLTLAKQFTPATILPYETSELTITVTNPNGWPATFNLSDEYDSKVVNTSAAPSTTCSGAIIEAPAGESAIAITNATVAADSSCSIIVSVTSSISGAYTNTLPAGAIVSIGNTNAAPASATLTVDRLPAPAITKSFAEQIVDPGVPVRMTITITNPNSGAIEGLTFTDDYPSNLVNANPSNAATTCTGGTLSAPAGGSFISLSDASVPASGSCTVTVDVVALNPGTIRNTIPAGTVTSANALPSAAAATAAFGAAGVDIPTASEWALLMTALALGVIAVLRLRHA